MNSNDDIWVIVPCYNEEESIGGLLRRLLDEVPGVRVVVVNDGSSDNSVEVIRAVSSPRLTLLELPFNCGIGTAVQTGLQYAVRSGAQYAVKFDGDGQHLPEEIALLLEPLRKGSADLVIGSRFLTGNDGFKSTWQRRFGIRLFRWLIAVLSGETITDSTSGFRGYNRTALEYASIHYPAFDYPEPEETMLFLRNGFKVLEVSCKMAPRSGGLSSIRPHKAAYYMLKVCFAVLMEGIRRGNKSGRRS